MKIISKYKDYYDYLQGVYGVDEKLILDRREGKQLPYLTRGTIHFIICDRIVEVFYDGKQMYAGENELSTIGEIKEDKDKKTGEITKHAVISFNTQLGDSNNWNNWRVECQPKKPNKYYLNLYKCPIYHIVDLYNKEFIPFPKLSEYHINKIIPAHDMWVMLSEWLGQRITENEPEVPIGDDNVRILSHGFDLKKSFRHRK